MSTEQHNGCVDKVDTSTLVTRTEYKETRDKSVLPMSPPLSFWLELIRRPIRPFRGVEGRTPEAWTGGISVPLELATSTEALLRELNRLACYSRRPPLCHDHNGVDFDVNAPLPCPVRLVCAPSLDPPQLRRRQSLVIRKSRTAIVPAAVISPHFQDAENAFLERKDNPLIHHGQAAQGSQYGCIISMLLLT